MEEKKNIEIVKKYKYAIGRNKTAIATIRLFEGKGENQINGKSLKEVVTEKQQLDKLLKPLKVVNLIDSHYFTAKTVGGGRVSQLNAVMLALARSIVKYDSSLKPELKKYGLLTRDPRMKERKKPGLKKARKKEQYSKR